VKVVVKVDGGARGNAGPAADSWAVRAVRREENSRADGRRWPAET
jgi:hypothetical protein